jgi:hypothetical protein
MAVARFWSAALDRPLDDGSADGFASIGMGDSSRPGWFFISVPEVKATKNRVHVDFQAEDREAEVDRLVALGAKRFEDHEEGGHRWTTLLDVEGNEFCVV